MTALDKAHDLALRLLAEGRIDDAVVIRELIDEQMAEMQEAIGLLKTVNSRPIVPKQFAALMINFLDRRLAELGRVQKAGAENIKATDDLIRQVWETRGSKNFKTVAGEMGLSEKQAADRLALLGLRAKREYKRVPKS